MDEHERSVSCDFFLGLFGIFVGASILAIGLFNLFVFPTTDSLVYFCSSAGMILGVVVWILSVSMIIQD